MPFEFVPQKLIYGGDALGHHEGRPVFVPRVLPGERVDVEEGCVAKGVVHARPLRILAPSPERVEPPCPYFGGCGGCHYQHLAPQPQVEVKTGILRETLRRTGKIHWEKPIRVHTADPQGYRNQAQIKVARGPNGRVDLGFYEAKSHRVYPVDHCLLLSGRLNQVLHEFRGERWAVPLAGCTEIELFADDHDERIAVVLRGHPAEGKHDTLAQEIVTSAPGVVSVAFETGGGLKVFGASTLTYSVGEFRYQVSPDLFSRRPAFYFPSWFLPPPKIWTAISPWTCSRGLACSLYRSPGSSGR